MPADNPTTLEARIERLESRLDARFAFGSPAAVPALGQGRLAVAGAVLAGSLYLSYLGLGVPNHPYQLMLGALATALAYHRGWLRRPGHVAGWALAILNAAQVAVLFKLLIGSGIRRPLSWVQYPSLSKAPPSGSWLNVLPELQLQWSSAPMATWEIDLTLTQTFLLIVTLIGALFRFQPFASLTALLLILCSLPAFHDFNWTWVFPAMILATVGLYVQTPEPSPEN